MLKTKVKDKYQGLSRQELLDKVYDLGFNFEKYSESCSQTTAIALHEILDIDDVVVKVATSVCAGHAGEVIGTCGALIGGTMVLDYFFGRPAENMSYQERIEANMEPLVNAIEVAHSLYDKYFKKYGTILCPHIHVQLYGRHYYFLDPDEMEKFNKAGGHSDPEKSCCMVVGTAARWVMEILLDKGVVEL